MCCIPRLQTNMLLFLACITELSPVSCRIQPHPSPRLPKLPFQGRILMIPIKKVHDLGQIQFKSQSFSNHNHSCIINTSTSQSFPYHSLFCDTHTLSFSQETTMEQPQRTYDSKTAWSNGVLITFWVLQVLSEGSLLAAYLLAIVWQVRYGEAGGFIYQSPSDQRWILA